MCVSQVPEIDTVFPQIIFSHGFDDFADRRGKGVFVFWQSPLELESV